MRLDRILVPTDFSSSAAAVLERAVGLALRHDAHLQVFHCEELHSHESGKAAQLQRETMQSIERARDMWAAGGRTSSARFEYAVAGDASAYDAIVRACETYKPDLIAMATGGGGPFVSSLTERILFNLPYNVLSCRRRSRGDWPTEGGRIVVSVDFSENSKRAVEAAHFYGGPRCPLTLLHVVEPPQHRTQSAHRIQAPRATDPHLKATLTQRLREWAADHASSVVVVEGNVRAGILEHVRSTDAVLVVVGTSGLHGPRRHLFGTTAQHLSRSSAAPVLAVR